MRLNLTSLSATLAFPIFLSSCFFEANGCSSDICVSASQQSCTDDDCQTELLCEDSDLIEQRMADIISVARDKARQCGGDRYPAADAVFWNAKLAAAALRHSKDMAANNFFSHTGSDGTSVSDRTENEDYDYRLLAENIAAGQQTSTHVVSEWLSSPGHCVNIMTTGLKEIGAACVRDPGTDYETYWTLVLAAPRTP